MNALRAPLTALPTPTAEVSKFLLDTADDFIDGHYDTHGLKRNSIYCKYISEVRNGQARNRQIVS